MAQATLGRLYTTKTITDRKVINTAGERLGEIQDLVIDVSAGCISYAVLSYSGGFLNMNRKHFAVPWEAFKIDEAHRDLVLDIDEERLRNSPGFDRDEWPSEPDPTFAQSVHDYYGHSYPPSGRERAGQSGGQDYDVSQGPPGQGYAQPQPESREGYEGESREPYPSEPNRGDQGEGRRW